MSTSRNHYVKKWSPSSHPLLSAKYCLAGGGKSCVLPVEFLIGYVYSKYVTTKHGSHVIDITARRPACRWHAERFAEKNHLQVP